MSFFGSINRFISRLDADAEQQNSNVGGAYGFQVLRNKSTELKIEPWFDHIIGINGRTIVSRKKCIHEVQRSKHVTGQSRSESVRDRSTQLCWKHHQPGHLERKGRFQFLPNPNAVSNLCRANVFESSMSPFPQILQA